MDARGAVEAALFASAKGLRVIDIANQTGLTEEAVRAALKQLSIEYERMGSAIKIAKIDAEYAFQLREEYAHTQTSSQKRKYQKAFRERPQ